MNVDVLVRKQWAYSKLHPFYFKRFLVCEVAAAHRAAFRKQIETRVVRDKILRGHCLALEGLRILARHASVWQRGKSEFVLKGRPNRVKQPKRLVV